MDHTMDTAVESVTIIRANALNHREFCKIIGTNRKWTQRMIYHTNVGWLSLGSVLQTFFIYWNRSNIFTTKKNKNT